MSGSGSAEPAAAWSLRVSQTAIDPAWIDYNGHLRDGYYALIASASIDALMDDLGLDEQYRSEQRCTLYTVEMHIRFLGEVKGDDLLTLDRYAVEFDAKRLRLLIAMRVARSQQPVAVVDVMLLHVHQGEAVTTRPFPVVVQQRLAACAEKRAPADILALGSRPLTLTKRP